MEVFMPKTLKAIPEVEGSLHFFFDLMVRKLDLNRHKGFVDSHTVHELHKRLLDEVEELRMAINQESQFEAAIECADVANQAFLLALKIISISKDVYMKERINV
jgi:hypothetical protein